MRYTYLSAQCVQGIVHPATEPDVVLFEDAKRGVRVVLTANAIPHLGVLNRNLALLTMLFHAMFNDAQASRFQDHLAEQVAKIEKQRLEAIRSDPVVIIELTGELDVTLPDNVKTFDDFIVCFDAFDKKALRSQRQSDIDAVLTGLRIGENSPYAFRSVTEGMYLTTEEGRVVHSVSVEGGSMGAYASRPITTEQRGQLADDIRLVLNAGKLERVLRLFAHSTNRATDNYRAFIAGWSALEILIGKLFPIYQQRLVAELRAVSQAGGFQKYLDRVGEVMNGKHSLADKFAVVSVYLDDQGQGDEVKAFRELKEVRDDLFHGRELLEDTLPTRDVQRLFEKYLRNHLRGSGS